VRTVRLTFDEASLARLDEISRHPIISKGVRTIRIALHFYSRSFESFEVFFAYYKKQLKLWAKRMGIFSALDPRDVSEQTARELTAEAEEPRDRIYHIHQRYMALLQKQQLLLETEQFYQAVASALGRMPCARGLCFDYRNQGCLRFRSEFVTKDNPEAILNQFDAIILEPYSGWEVKRYMSQAMLPVELPSYKFVPRMINALGESGTLLNSLSFCLNSTGKPGSIAPSPAIRSTFVSSLQQLRNFHFFYDNEIESTVTDFAGLTGLLSACLDTSSLQKVHLDISSEVPAYRHINLGSVMGTRPRQNLTDVLFYGVEVDVSNYLSLLKRLPESLRSFSHGQVHLLNGSWKEPLDVLRDKKCNDIILWGPVGDGPDELYDTFEDYLDLEENTQCEHSLVDHYVNNTIPNQRNPFLVLEERDWDDTSASEDDTMQSSDSDWMEQDD